MLHGASEYGAVWFEYSFVTAPEIVNPVYALTNVVTTLAEVEDQLPAGWKWVAPDTKLAAFAGMREKEFAVKYVNELTGEEFYDTATVELSTIKNVTLSDVPAKLASQTDVEVTASYEVTGEMLSDEIINKLSWCKSVCRK